MNVAIIIATCGEQKWQDLALKRAAPSAYAEYQQETDRLLTTDHLGPIPTLPPLRTRSIYISHYEDLTVAQARNQAVKDWQEGDWLCFLDADDELERGYIDAMQNALYAAFPESGWVGTAPLLVPAVRRVWNNDLRSSTRAEIPNRGRWPKVNECVIGTLVKRDLFNAVGGFRDHTDSGERILMYEDWDLWLRCWNSGAQLVHVDEAVYREHVNQEGRNTNAHLAQQVYDAIWNDHVRDTAVLGRD